MRNQSYPQPPLWPQAHETAVVAGASVLPELNSPRLPALAGIWAASITLFAYAPVATAISRRLRGEHRVNVVQELFEQTMRGVYPGAEQGKKPSRSSTSKWGPSRGAAYDTSTFQRQDRLHSSAVYTIVVHDLLRLQELFYRRLNHIERTTYCRDAQICIAAQLAPEGRIPQTYDELAFHHRVIVERQITVDKQFGRLYENFKRMELDGVPIGELTRFSAPALPPAVVGVLGLTEVARAPFPSLAPYDLTAHSIADIGLRKHL